MQIIIPMSGFGERFRKAGYTIPKPLIEIEGNPIIGHVIDMFPGETDFIFICNEDHLNEPLYDLRNTLKKLCPTGKIISIPPHKLGPIYAVLQASAAFDLKKPTIINYCDFTCYWNWEHFKKWVQQAKCAGAVPAYSGFHPHTLGTTNYAYIREQNNWMIDIQEKQPYTNNRMDEFASSGTYYFSSGELMLQACRETINQNLHINGEFYVSLAYKFLLKQKLPIAIYTLQHFMQWGTPEDVAEYSYWSSIFKRKQIQTSSSDPVVDTTIIPMAGLGERFLKEGYVVTKPLINVSGQPMVVQATNHLPKAKRYIFILREDMPNFEILSKILQDTYPNTIIKTVPSLTQGQACSALIGIQALQQQLSDKEIGTIIFGACDNGAYYNEKKLLSLIEDPTIDIIVWGTRCHPHAAKHPTMYGWINVINDRINNISVKKPLSSPDKDPIVIGTFIFKRAQDFCRATEAMINSDRRVNGEFYLDTCINTAIQLGLTCSLFEVDNYLSWGTPNDLRTFEYWQSCFHKWPTHPYELSLDKDIAINEREKLAIRFRTMLPETLE